MSWTKKAKMKKTAGIKKIAGCDGIFSEQDFANYMVIANSPYAVVENDPQAMDLKAELWSELYCPMADLVKECNKAIHDHLKKVALHKSGRYFGDKKEVQQITPDSPPEHLRRLLENSSRSSAHSVESLEQQLKSKGIEWQEAVDALSMAGLYNPRVQSMDYYIKEIEGAKRFADYNWKYLSDQLVKLQAALSTRGKIFPLIEAADFVLNAVHNTTMNPVNYLHNIIVNNIGLVREDRPSVPEMPTQRIIDLGESVLTYMKYGEAILRHLNAKRDAKLAGPDLQSLKGMADSSVKKVVYQLERLTRGW